MKDSSKVLHFHSEVAMKKPENIVNRTVSCPFCDIQSLEEVYEKQGSIIWIKNKFSTLQDTLQTVLIETDECDSELSLYTPEHMKELFRFAVSKWLEMEESGKYCSVILFKNYGPLSGGSIRHPHMQIVGMEHADYREGFSREDFSGNRIAEKGMASLSLTDRPMIGFTELAVKIKRGYTSEDLDQAAMYTQTAVHFLLNHFHPGCKSYNLFFYEFDGSIYVRIVPRFVVTPLYVGYKLQQITDNNDRLTAKIKEIYF